MISWDRQLTWDIRAWTHQIYHVLFLEQERKKAEAVGGA